MKRKKILLYNPHATFYTMPLALIALGSNIDRSKYDVRIIDGRLESDPVAAILAEVDDALCLGVTVLTGSPIRDALRVTRAAKAQRPDLPVVWGGWHASLFPTKTLEEPSIDITVQGQGERAFVEIVDRLAAGEDMLGVKGTAFRDNGRPMQNLSRDMIDMNALPAHDYDLVDMERYFALKGSRQLDYISSTGCFFRCTFCADPHVFKRKWSGIEPVRMADELEELWRRHRFADVAFQDETFFTYSERVTEMAEEFLRRGLGFTWTGTMRADQCCRLTDAELDLYVRSGLRWVMIGVESGSPQMLEWMKKDVTVEQILESAERCARHGLTVIFPFIVGFPGESDESIRQSLDLVKRLRSMSPRFETPIFYYKPYPGSQIVDDVVAAGYALPEALEEWADFDFVEGSSGPWVTPEKYDLIERFKFYNRFAWGAETLRRWPLQKVARWRCTRNFYGFPVEKKLVERLRRTLHMS